MSPLTLWSKLVKSWRWGYCEIHGNTGSLQEERDHGGKRISLGLVLFSIYAVGDSCKYRNGIQEGTGVQQQGKGRRPVPSGLLFTFVSGWRETHVRVPGLGTLARFSLFIWHIRYASHYYYTIANLPLRIFFCPSSGRCVAACEHLKGVPRAEPARGPVEQSCGPVEGARQGGRQVAKASSYICGDSLCLSERERRNRAGKEKGGVWRVLE